ncbi:PASTA domain-containing protein [Sulfidibacter corallicola]|uniref:PASTA domain-containing protein n=1 Tax=Sulfidibacter corallicola TaxID=2818388 RepID=A0A8A4TSS8_SULCO|nr:PASTA domain-containing protein [Sulfidibacter corallicola]QTD52214.1 PASTA domain-containing protein [Sulfidibacter corallicola]
MAFRKTLKKLLGTTVLVGLGFSLFIAGITLGTWFYIRHMVQGKVVEVPDLYGMTQVEAEKSLKARGLIPELDTQSTVHSQVIEKGNVLLQIPRPGHPVKAGRAIEIIMSAGPEKKLIPSMQGETLSYSQTLLQRAEAKAAVVSRIPSTLEEKGRILAQHPDAASEIGMRPGVSLLVSDGPPSKAYVMPDLIDRDFIKVKAFLDRFEFRVVTKYRAQDRGLGQVVLDQRPQPGYPITKNQSITLIVNEDF